MLAWPPDVQKPRRVLSFQNTKQGLFAFQFNCGKNLNEHETFHSLPLAAAAAITVLSEPPQAQAPPQPLEEPPRRPPSASPGSR
jgi:hypothetical protein